MIYRCGPATYEFTRAGRLTGIRHPAAPGVTYVSLGALRSGGPGTLHREWSVISVDPEDDELEVTYAPSAEPSGPTAVLRHTFGPSWGMRLTVRNPSDSELRMQLRLPVSVPVDAVGWVWAADAEAEMSVHPESGHGPILGGSLRSGSVVGATADGLDLGEVALAPGARHSWQWQFGWYDCPLDLVEVRRHQPPGSLYAEVGRAVEFEADPDVAVVPSASLTTRADGNRYEVLADGPGAHPVQLRSARGTTTLRLTWVPPLEDFLLAMAGRLLDGPRTSAGVVRLPSLAAAMVVQWALAHGGAGGDDAEEALDRLTAELLDTAAAAPAGSAAQSAHAATTQLGPLSWIYLCGEADRTGEEDPLIAARTAFLASAAPSPGSGIAGLRLCLAAAVRQQPLVELRHHLRELRAAPHPSTISDRAALLELLAVTRVTADRRAHDATDWDRLLTLAGALGAQLGGGLIGEPLRPRPVAVAGHLLAALALLPDDANTPSIGRWGHPVSEVGHRAALALISRLLEQPVSEAHAWLLLAARPG